MSRNDLPDHQEIREGLEDQFCLEVPKIHHDKYLQILKCFYKTIEDSRLYHEEKKTTKMAP